MKGIYIVLKVTGKISYLKSEIRIKNIQCKELGIIKDLALVAKCTLNKLIDPSAQENTFM
jgi:hypothetical protein